MKAQRFPVSPLTAGVLTLGICHGGFHSLNACIRMNEGRPANTAADLSAVGVGAFPRKRHSLNDL